MFLYIIFMCVMCVFMCNMWHMVGVCIVRAFVYCLCVFVYYAYVCDVYLFGCTCVVCSYELVCGVSLSLYVCVYDKWLEYM